MQVLWGLASFPYMIFLLPYLGSSLHGAKPTAYDQAGHLVPKLTGALIKRKRREDEEREQIAGAATPEDNALCAAATTLQRHTRGKRLRKRMLRHFVALATPAGLLVPADTIEQWF